jgi:hypothetical protein
LTTSLKASDATEKVGKRHPRAKIRAKKTLHPLARAVPANAQLISTKRVVYKFIKLFVRNIKDKGILIGRPFVVKQALGDLQYTLQRGIEGRWRQAAGPNKNLPLKTRQRPRNHSGRKNADSNWRTLERFETTANLLGLRRSSDSNEHDLASLHSIFRPMKAHRYRL